jgi:hypothetical protein
MSESFEDRLRKAPAATERAAVGLIRELVPKILFFFVAFLLIFLTFRMFVENYSPVTFPAFTRAAIAALILGKVVPILEWAEGGHHWEKHRRIVVVIARTIVYAMVVMVLGTAERFFRALHDEGSFGGAVHFVLANASTAHFFGLVLLLGIVVGAYLTLEEIDDALGKGTLYRVLLERRAKKDGTTITAS